MPILRHVRPGGQAILWRRVSTKISTDALTRGLPSTHTDYPCCLCTFIVQGMPNICRCLFFSFSFFFLQGLKGLRLGVRIGPFPNCISHQRDDETLITIRLRTTSVHVQLSYVEPPKRRTLTLPHIGCQVEGCVSALADQSLIFRRQVAALPTASVRSTALPGEYDNLKSMFSDCKSLLRTSIVNRGLLGNENDRK